MPFADYADFAECVAKNGDKEDPEAYCAAIKAQAEGRTMSKTDLAVRNEKANELFAKAEELERKIADPAVEMTKEEVQKAVEGIAAYRQRGLAVADHKPEQVAEKRGLVKVESPEAEQEVSDLSDFKRAEKDVIGAFGGTGAYLLALARLSSPHARAWNERQKAAHERFQGLQKRVIVGTASDASGGEFLLPLTQAPDIFVGAAIEQAGLFERAPRYAAPGRTVRIPYLIQDADTDTRPLSGIAATAIVGEGSEKDEREPSIGQRTVTAYKWAAYTEAADEVLEDDYTGQLPTMLRIAIGGDLRNSINLAVTRTGTGTAQPLGALHTNNGALITVNRNTSQSIEPVDVHTMLSRSTMGPRAFWLAHPSTIPQIYGMQLSAGSNVTFLNNLTEGGGGRLSGFPLIFTHLMSILGVAADLALIDPDQYAVVLRKDVTVESSIHYRFRNDITAYRFLARAGGAPIPGDTYSFAGSGSAKTWEFSGFVRLGDDVTS